MLGRSSGWETHIFLCLSQPKLPLIYPVCQWHLDAGSSSLLSQMHWAGSAQWLCLCCSFLAVSGRQQAREAICGKRRRGCRRPARPAAYQRFQNAHFYNGSISEVRMYLTIDLHLKCSWLLHVNCQNSLVSSMPLMFNSILDSRN